MKLGQLRKLLEEYKADYWLRISTRGMHKRAIQIERFLAKYQHHSPDYQLTMSDLLQLTRLILTVEADLSLIDKIRKAISLSATFFELVQKLDACKAIDAEIFEELHNSVAIVILLDKAWSSFERILEKSPGKTEKIDLIKFLICLQKAFPSFEKIQDRTLLLCKSLQRQQLPGSNVMDLIKANTHHYRAFCDFSESLSLAKYPLEEDLVRQFFHRPNAIIAQFINRLSALKLPLTAEILSLILPLTQVRLDIMQTYMRIMDCEGDLFDRDQMTGLFKKDSSYVAKACDTLREAKLLDKDTIHALLQAESPFSLSNILELLKKAAALNRENLKLLLEKVTQPSHLADFMTFLLEKNCLESRSFAALVLMDPYEKSEKTRVFTLLCEAQEIDSQILWAKIEKYSRHHLDCLLSIGKILQGTSLFTKGMIEELLEIKNDYFPKMFEILQALKNAHKLNANTFMMVIRQMSIKMPMPQEVTANFEEGHYKEIPWKQINANDNSIFIREDASQCAGGRGIVHKGYADLDADTPKKLVKILREGESFQFQETRREVKYHRFFSRDADFFRHDNQYYLISDWVEGESLDKTEASVLKAMPVEKRLEALMHLNTGLLNLHENFRIHGDIKPSNCVMDNQGILHWIDFGSTRKLKYKHYDIAETPNYLPWKTRYSHTNQYSFATDMYCFGYIVAALFPEIFAITEKVQVEVSLLLTSMTPQEEAIKRLRDCLMEKNAQARCTSKSMNVWLQKILAEFSGLSASRLETICQMTINNPEATAEDILVDRTLQASVG